MSSNQATVPSKSRALKRLRLPGVILGMGAIAIVGIWLLPTEEWEPARRVVLSIMISLFAGLLLGVWFLFLSGIGWKLRLAVLLLVAAGGILLIQQARQVKLSGDMVPSIRFGWDLDPNDVLEKQRKAAAQQQVPEIKNSTNPSLDFPEYRGRRRDGVVSGPPPLTSYRKAQPPREIWRQPVGGGYSGFSVAGNALVTLEQRRDQEAVVCYDTETGGERWIHAYQAHFSEALGGPGPRATPTIAGDDIFSLGATGKLVCLEMATGILRWSVDILKGNQNIQWGMSGSPLVYDKVVVVNPGVQTAAAAGKALVAYDRETGKEVWHGGNKRAGYSSPMLATLAGQRQILLFDGEGIGGYDADNGKELWWLEWANQQGIHVAQPVVLEGDRVFVTSAYSVGCTMLHIVKSADGFAVEPLWRNKNMRCKFTSPVLYQGFLYGLDEGYLVCVDSATGDRKWKGRSYGHGQLLLSGATLVILGESGNLALAVATPEWDKNTQNELVNIPAIHGKTWNCHALVQGKAFIRNDAEMACYDLRSSSGDQGSDKK